MYIKQYSVQKDTAAIYLCLYYYYRFNLPSHDNFVSHFKSIIKKKLATLLSAPMTKTEITWHCYSLFETAVEVTFWAHLSTYTMGSRKVNCRQGNLTWSQTHRKIENIYPKVKIEFIFKVGKFLVIARFYIDRTRTLNSCYRPQSKGDNTFGTVRVFVWLWALSSLKHLTFDLCFWHDTVNQLNFAAIKFRGSPKCSNTRYISRY